MINHWKVYSISLFAFPLKSLNQHFQIIRFIKNLVPNSFLTNKKKNLMKILFFLSNVDIRTKKKFTFHYLFLYNTVYLAVKKKYFEESYLIKIIMYTLNSTQTPVIIKIPVIYIAISSFSMYHLKKTTIIKD